MSEEKKRSWKRPWRAGQRRGGKVGRPADPIAAPAPLSLADAVVAIMRDPKVMLPLPYDLPLAPTPALRADPPPQAGEGEEKIAPHDSPAHDAPPSAAPSSVPGRAPVERPWIPAAVRAQMGHIDPRFPVERIIETEWPDERASDLGFTRDRLLSGASRVDPTCAMRPRLQERAWRSPREAEEGEW